MRKKAIITSALLAAALSAAGAPSADPVGAAVKSYFDTAFKRLGAVAAKKPTVDTFRKAMKPCAEATDGFFGGTYIDTDYTIRQTYFRRNFLARGFSLRKVDELEWFWNQMDTHPAPQLSEPGHGSLIQPRLVAMRYPIITDGKLEGVVSMMVRTEAFLEAVGLDQCPAYRIICRGEPAEEKGELSAHYREVKLDLPSTEWVVQYDPPASDL